MIEYKTGNIFDEDVEWSTASTVWDSWVRIALQEHIP